MKLILIITSLVLVFANDGIGKDDYITDNLIEKLAAHHITRDKLRKYLEDGGLESRAVLYGVYIIFNIEPPSCLETDNKLQEYLHKTPQHYDDDLVNSISELLRIPYSGS